jgi:V-type H+-transporting ATPase subunit H
MSTKLISSTSLQLLKRYDHKPEAQRGPLLDEVSSFIVLDLFLFAVKNIETTTVQLPFVAIFYCLTSTAKC